MVQFDRKRVIDKFEIELTKSIGDGFQFRDVKKTYFILLKPSDLGKYVESNKTFRVSEAGQVSQLVQARGWVPLKANRIRLN